MKIEKNMEELKTVLLIGEGYCATELAISEDGFPVVVRGKDDGWVREYLDRPQASHEIARAISEGLQKVEWDPKSRQISWMKYEAPVFAPRFPAPVFVSFETYFGGVDSDGIRIHRNADPESAAIVSAWIADDPDRATDAVAGADEAGEEIRLNLDFSVEFRKK